MVTMMDLNKYLIELDEYLDLTELELVEKEFANSVNKVPKKYINTFRANGYPLEKGVTYRDGVNTIYLRDLKPEYEKIDNYSMIDKSIYWEDFPVYDYFPILKKLISKTPFKDIGRILIVYSKDIIDSIIHRDHISVECCNEFIWLRSNKNKRIFVMINGERIYIKGYSCWFDSREFHGSEVTEKYSMGVRIDGEFTSDFREKLFGKNSKWKSLPIIDI